MLSLLLACSGSSPAPSQPVAPTVVQVADPVQPETVDPVVAALRANPLAYTRHAECRMDCRNVEVDEVRDALAHGELDPTRSRDDGRCPSHALHHTSDDGQALRVVFAACETETLVVTVIDLGTDWPCDCD